MHLALSFFIALAGGVSAPAITPQSAAVEPRPQKIIQTIYAQSDGTTRVESRTVDAEATTLQAIGPGGRTIEATWQPEKRVLIEIRERPVLDNANPGSVSAAVHQRQQLAQDLMALDARLEPRIPSRITREFQTLFSGVAATVDSAIIDEIRQLPNVAAVHEDFEVRASLTESVPLIGATTVASTYGVTGLGIRVAVIDTGIDYTHPDLGGCFGIRCRVVGGHDFVNNDDDPSDDHGHGTHVAGIIGANGTLKGVAPGVMLLAYKVLDANGSGFNSDVIAALEQAVLDGAQVANLSLGGGGSPDDPTSQAVDNATEAGMLSVVAAGNSGSSYRTISSPGVARTALTVGATDKSWQMASFSSRGYVTDGDDLVMKPEVVAPGVDIRSTVPLAGELGDPTGYAVLSGTSMATPHVAGSAALLLQWDGAQTAEDLKIRLAASARVIDADVFTKGAGGIDLVAAFGLRVRPSKTHVSLGVFEATSGIVQREQTITVRNTASTADTLTLAVSSALPEGATLEILPSSATLPPGGTVDVILRLRVDTAVVPEPAEPMAWSTSIAITGQAQTANVPLYFFRGSVLTLSFDEAPWFVILLSGNGDMRHLPSRTSMSVLVKSGLWDVITFFVSPVAIVVREQQNVQHSLSLSIARGEATLEAAVRAVDDAQQPLNDWEFVRKLMFNVPGLTSTTSAPDNFRLSELSSRYLVGVVGVGPDPSGQRYFSSSWSGKGVASDIILPTTAPFRRLGHAAVQPSGMPPAILYLHAGFAMKTSWGGFASLIGTGKEGELNRLWHMQANVSPDSPFLPIQNSALYVFSPELSAQFRNSAYLHQQGADLEVNQSPFFNLLDPANAPEAVLGPAVERWDLDTAPYALPIEFWNLSSSGIVARGLFDSANWLTHTLTSIKRFSTGEPTFTLQRMGGPAVTYPFSSLAEGVVSEQGSHELRASSGYMIGGVPGSSQVVISFDTSNFDPHPPVVSRFRIEQNFVRTSTPFHPAKIAIPTVQFRVTDRANFLPGTVSTVKLEWRTNGTPNWTEVTLSNSGPDYSATLPHGGAIDLRVTAVDSVGNTFQEEWTPAVITTPATPPSPPTFITATRAAASAISVSWAGVSSPVGIAGYRIERLPDNATMTTSGTATTFVDTNGLVSGNAYLYRVSAVDTNDAISTPTAYDLATLIELRDDPVVPMVTPIRGIHIVDLRRAIDAIRQAAGLGSAWTNYDPPTGIVRASVFVELRDRLNEARGTLQLPTVEFSNSVTPGAPVRANDLLILRDGVK